MAKHGYWFELLDKSCIFSQYFTFKLSNSCNLSNLSIDESYYLLMHFKNSSSYHFNKLLIHVKDSQNFWCGETTKCDGDDILAKQWTNLFKMIQTNVTQNNKNKPSQKHCEKMKFHSNPCLGVVWLTHVIFS
jgi:hypothetical protein